jgi:hypothetical protein
MPTGPLPKEDAARNKTHEPTIPTTRLPPRGRRGKPPPCPRAYKLKPTGRAWWNWAWKTPQAAAWSTGDLYAIARRAMLEDELHKPTNESLTAAGVLREIRELDDRLGLTPKAMAALRWRILDGGDGSAKPAPKHAAGTSNVYRLPAFDPAAAGE